MKTKMTAFYGMFLALALVAGYVERLIPINLGIPGVKLGLANIVMVVVLYMTGWKDAALISLSRVLLAGFFFGNTDTYVNIAGGLKIDEPASDLSVAAALVSSLRDVPVKENLIAFGEIGLGGEIRAVSNCEQRIKEASRLGFSQCIIPYHN